MWGAGGAEHAPPPHLSPNAQSWSAWQPGPQVPLFCPGRMSHTAGAAQSSVVLHADPATAASARLVEAASRLAASTVGA